MIAVLFTEKKNYSRVREILLKDDLVSRQSINFKDNSSLGLQEEGYYIKIDGSKEGIDRAKELLKDLGKELSKDHIEKILEIIKRQDESADQGFGSIFG